MTNKESAESAIPYSSHEVDELTAWSRQEGWTPIPATVHRLLATLRAIEQAAELLRLRYEECAQCHASLSEPPPGCPPHCDDCTVDDAHLEAWDEAVGN